MINFCTLFNANYMARGLVMYDSLVANATSFHLYVFTFDDKTTEILRKLALPHLTVITLEEFEDPALLAVKPGRTPAEYCWTCTPSTILYCIQKFNLENCIYIDADMQFYSDPAVLVEEMGGDSVMITEHRYNDEATLRLKEGSGKYCVQFVAFRNDSRGMKVLHWWRDACLDWCYARYEDGKFGDQKYLDDWTTRFEGVHELQHLGGGLAPWNIQQYSFTKDSGQITGTEKKTGKKFAAVFFHYHGVRFFENKVVVLTGSNYALDKNVKNFFYKPYIRLLVEKASYLSKIDKSFDANGAVGISPAKPLNLLHLLKFYWYELKISATNAFSPKFLERIDHHHYHDISHF